MTRVRRHLRQTASGKTVAVRQHHREVRVTAVEDTSWWDRAGDEPGQASPDDPEGTTYFRQGDGTLCAVHPDGTVHEVEPAEAEATPADSPALASMKQEMREWRSRPMPASRPAEPMSPQKAALLGCDTPEGMARYMRLSALRDAGYRGPLDSRGCIPDPDDAAEHESLSCLAAPGEIGKPSPPPRRKPADPVAWKDAGPDERARRVADLREARAELERISKRDRSETEDFLDANDRVIEAERHVSPWRRWWTSAGEGS